MRSLIKRMMIWMLLLLAAYIAKIYYIDHSTIEIQMYEIVPTVSAAMTAINPATDNLSLPVFTSSTNTSISPIFTREVQFWSNSITYWADLYGLDKNLVATVMQIESCGNPYAVSSAGAMGLFQVMPFHFTAYEDPYNPEVNAMRGLSYLKKSLDTSGGETRLALAGYNGGVGVISRGEWTWASETTRYVQYGHPIFLDANGGFATSASLDEWYGKYGAGLCRQAAQKLGIE